MVVEHNRKIVLIIHRILWVLNHMCCSEFLIFWFCFLSIYFLRCTQRYRAVPEAKSHASSAVHKQPLWAVALYRPVRDGAAARGGLLLHSAGRIHPLWPRWHHQSKILVTWHCFILGWAFNTTCGINSLNDILAVLFVYFGRAGGANMEVCSTTQLIIMTWHYSS